MSVLQRAADALGGRRISSRKFDRAIVEQEAHISSHADWANVQMAKARIERREKWKLASKRVKGAVFWLVALTVWGCVVWSATRQYGYRMGAFWIVAGLIIAAPIIGKWRREARIRKAIHEWNRDNDYRDEGDYRD